MMMVRRKRRCKHRRLQRVHKRSEKKEMEDKSRKNNWRENKVLSHIHCSPLPDNAENKTKQQKKTEETRQRRRGNSRKEETKVKRCSLAILFEFPPLSSHFSALPLLSSPLCYLLFCMLPLGWQWGKRKNQNQIQKPSSLSSSRIWHE